MPSFLSFVQEAHFPNLDRQSYHVTSPRTGSYNCIAFAAGKSDNWWWPVGRATLWPVATKALTLGTFVQAYQSLGYEICPKQSVTGEQGVDRVAIYVDATGVPTHAARQLAGGKWTSKLGAWEDIQHDTLEALSDRDGLGLGYGTVGLIMRRVS